MRMVGVADCAYVFHGAPGDVHRPTYAISRAQPAHHLYVAATASVIPRRAGVEDKPLRRECEGVRAKPAV